MKKDDVTVGRKRELPPSRSSDRVCVVNTSRPIPSTEKAISKLFPTLQIS